MDTPKITIIYAIALIILGIGGYVSTGMVHITSLIPTFFGIVVLILGILAKKENIRKHVLVHVASTPPSLATRSTRRSSSASASTPGSTAVSVRRVM